MPYTNGLVWGRGGGVLSKSAASAPYGTSMVDITTAELEADADSIIRIPCHGVQFIGLTSLAENTTGGVGANAAKYYYYGMNSDGEVGTPLEQSADAPHVLTELMHADLATVSSGEIATPQRTYTDTTGAIFVTASGAGGNAAEGGEGVALTNNLQLNELTTSHVVFDEHPLDVAGYFTDILYIGGFFQELVVAFDRGSMNPTTRFNVLANRVFY